MNITDRQDEFFKTAYINHDTAHNIHHAEAVHTNAQIIVAGEGIKPTPQEQLEFPLVMVGHDARDHKLVREGKCLDAPTLHKFYAAEAGESSAVKIAHIHNNCSWSTRATNIPLKTGDWMRLVLQDADWIEAINVPRCIDYTKSINGKVPDDVCDHIRQKLLLIADQLHYETSRKIVRERQLLKPLMSYLEQHEKKEGGW